MAAERKAVRGCALKRASAAAADNLRARGRGSRFATACAGTFVGCGSAGRSVGRGLIALWVIGGIGLALIVSASARSQEDPRLYDLEPYDVLTLKSGEVFKLRPLELRDRMLPANPRPNETLQVRLFDRPQQVYEVSWADIQSVKLFEELLLEQAARLVENRRFDEAFRYYRVLESRFGSFRGVAQAVQAAIFREAEWWQQQGNLNQALALLMELHSRDASHPQLQELFGTVANGLLSTLVEKERAEAAQRVLAEWSHRYPNDERLAAWRQQFAQRAQAALEQARQHAQQGQWFEARTLAVRALAWQPDLAPARALQERALAEHPMLSVGVVELAGAAGPWPLPSWAARRVARLTARALCEPVAGDAGGVRYAFPLGELAAEENRLSFKLRPDLAWADGRPASAADLARSMATLTQHGHVPGWELVFDPVWSWGEHELTVNLRGTRTAALGLLNMPLWRDVQPGLAPVARPGLVGLGPFFWQSSSEGLNRFVRNPAWPWQGTAGLREVVERRFPSVDSALQALRQGEVLLVDRLRPRDAARLANHNEVQVVPYTLPTVHLLLFHPHRPHTSQALFRRALAHATSRNAALAQLGAGTPEGAIALLRDAFPLDGPRTEDHAPHAYDPALAASLFAACQRAGERPQLLLAHPATDMARQACSILADQWALAGHGPQVQLVELPPATADSSQMPPEFDVLYVEWPAMDPMVDALRLCALEPLSQQGGPLLERAAASLAQSPDAAAARRALAAVMRTIHNRTLVLPLWQTTEYMARHRSLTGMPEMPSTTYDDIENWSIRE